MIKILFVCHGNICRSPMAEFLLKYKVKKMNIEKEFYIESAATSSEEIGNGIHYGTKKILDRFNIDYSHKIARKINDSDYNKFDLIIGMDERNIDSLNRIFYDENKKIYKLLDFTEDKSDISDPWYTHDFDQTYKDIIIGLEYLLRYLGYNENK